MKKIALMKSLITELVSLLTEKPQDDQIRWRGTFCSRQMWKYTPGHGDTVLSSRCRCISHPERLPADQQAVQKLVCCLSILQISIDDPLLHLGVDFKYLMCLAMCRQLCKIGSPRVKSVDLLISIEPFLWWPSCGGSIRQSV
jgi:hypothetical protein